MQFRAQSFGDLVLFCATWQARNPAVQLCLLMNEILNAVFKFIPARIVGKQAHTGHRLSEEKPGSRVLLGFGMKVRKIYLHRNPRGGYCCSLVSACMRFVCMCVARVICSLVQ